MKNNNTTMHNTVAKLAFLFLAICALSFLTVAQDQQGHEQHKAAGKDVVIGKKGQVHFTSQVKVGESVLKPGMYQVQHMEEGGDHVIIFKEMGMVAGYKHSNTPVGKEVARVKCKVEPVTKSVNNTKITLRTNAAGEKEIAEIQVAGEAFKHLL